MEKNIRLSESQPYENHALEDYQIQLMFLEEQNKKRLLMARLLQQEMLLETGKVEVDSKDSYGRTPLSWAATGI